jgi:hypothetical protein
LTPDRAASKAISTTPGATESSAPIDFRLALCPRGEDGVHLPTVGGGSTIVGVRAPRQVAHSSLARRHRSLSPLELFLLVCEALVLARELPEILKTQRPSAFAI